MKQIIVLIFILVFANKSFSQSEIDKQKIYSEVLKSFLVTKDTVKDCKFLVLDSTTAAQYPYQFHDSIYQKYFKIDKKDFDASYNFMLQYISFTKKFEAFPKELIKNDSLLLFKTDSVYSFFEESRKDKKAVEKCWGKFYHTIKCSGYCQFSKPYFMDKETAMIYFYEISGTSGSGWTYIFRKDGEKWRKVYQKLQWGS
ncbi:MAG: hypothetical protein HXX09_03650 [Bacteroidetes bacterium]|nr:hypothetical protein [Bacteroidota bacterium]